MTNSYHYRKTYGTSFCYICRKFFCFCKNSINLHTEAKEIIYSKDQVSEEEEDISEQLFCRETIPNS